MPQRPDPESIDDEAPEATEEWFGNARPATEVLPAMFSESVAKELLTPKCGRPSMTEPKEHVNIRLDADIVKFFRGTGAGWQTRLNNALREWLKSQAS